MKLRRYSLLGWVIAAIGLAVSFWLIPKGPEIALMHFRDRQYDMARRTYEQQLKSGSLSVSVVKPLTELYLEYGEVEQAVAVMERFVSQNPDNIQALRRLAKYYQYAQRPNEFLVTLEKITRLEVTEGDLRELSSIYNFVGQYDKQISTLKTLTERYPTRGQDFLDLANLQAAQGRAKEAVGTLKQFETRFPAAITAETAELLMSLMLDVDQGEAARARASAWLSEHPQPETVARFASLFHYKKEPALAWEILKPFEKIADSHPDLLAELVQVQIATGRAEPAFARLKALYEQRRLPDSSFESLIDLALERKDTELAFRAAQEKNLNLLPDWLLLNLAEMALASQRTDFAQEMVKKLGDNFLKGRPVLAAEIALARGDRTSAERWIAQAQQSDLSLEQSLALGGLYGRLGRRQEALALLARLASMKDVPDAVFSDLAENYLQLGRAREGLALFDQLRSRRSSPNILAGWALLAASAGRANEVKVWLESVPQKNLSDRLLRDLYYAASEAREPGLAVASAERLYNRRGGRAERLILANALVSAGRPQEALPHLRSLLPGGPEEVEAYSAALAGAVAKGAPVTEEARQFWTQQLTQPNLTVVRRREVVHALLELGAYATVLPTLATLARQQGGDWFFAYVDASVKSGKKAELTAFLQSELDRTDLSSEVKETRLYALIEHGGEAAALPYLKRFAESARGNWMFAYEEALKKLRRRDELIAFWKSLAARKDLPADEKRLLASRMLEAGQKELAEQVLLELAATAPPDSKDVAQLLFLWGPRPPKVALDWMETRAFASTGSARAAWLNHLINAGASRRASDVAAKQLPSPGSEPAVWDAYLAGLAAARDLAALAAAAEREISVTTDPSRLQRLARLCFENSQNACARQAYTKLLGLRPNDPEALRRLGVLSYWGSDYSAAKRYLASYLESGQGDYESNYYFGELLLREKNRAAAKTYYSRALEQIDRIQEKTLSVRIVRAHLLHRTGRIAEALSAFEAMLKERPDDKTLRAEYVGILLEEGRHDLAQKVLSGR
jgi:predicted Zn-dependent protease